MQIRQTGGDLTEFNFAQATVVLASRPCTMVARLRIGTFIQNHDATALQQGFVANIGPNLLEDRLRLPGGLGHEMLERLTIPPIQATVDIGKVALIFHGQLAPPKRPGTITGIARAGPETGAIELPEGVELIAELLHRVAGHTPAIWIEQIGREGDSVIL